MSEIPEDVKARARSYADAVTFGSYEQNAILIAKALYAEVGGDTTPSEQVGALIRRLLSVAPAAGLYIKIKVEAASSIRSQSEKEPT